MTLSSGARLGPYEILAPIVAGGMGEVYRAKDQRLGREVAIKVLPASFSQDADRLHRFEQEARSASALNHPDIITIHEIGGGAPRAVSPEGYRCQRHGVSPDGKFVIAIGPDQRHYLYPIAGGEPRPIPGVVPQDRIEGWTADGNGLVVHRRGDLPAKVYRLDIATGKKELWKELMPLETAGIGDVGGVILARDRRSYVYGTGWTLSDLYLVEGLK